MVRTIFGACSVSVLLIALLAVVVAAAADENKKPIFHLRPPKNWINDPNGPYRDPITKVMHLFMQYNPYDAVWGSINWYHFTSDDYVMWQDKGIALENDKDYDHWGAYSGSITHNEDGTPVMMYTCTADVNVQKQCIAVPPSADIQGPNAPRTLNSWVKSPKNPVLSEKNLPSYVGQENFRDPTNFWKSPDIEAEWLVAFVARMNHTEEGDVAHVVVFKTTDKTWQSGFAYSHSLWHDKYDFYHMLECPDFFQINGSYYLKVSTMISRQEIWVYGTYNTKDAVGNTIFAEDPKRTPTYIDYGSWYASKHNYDPVLNRTILWGWIVEDFGNDAFNDNESMRAQGWSGMMDMPRNVEYDEKANKLKTYPMPELEALRDKSLGKSMNAVFNASENANFTMKVPYQNYELIVDFTLPYEVTDDQEYEPGKEPSIEINLQSSADGEVYTRIAVAIPHRDPLVKTSLSGKKYRFVNVTSAAECEQWCAKERRCVAWTGVDESPYRCALMSTFGVTNDTNSSTTSGFTKDPVLLLDRTRSGTTGATSDWVGRAPLLDGNKVQLRVFVDGTAVQVFKDGGRESLSTRVYTNRDWTGFSIAAPNFNGTVSASISIFPMKSIYTASVGTSSASVNSGVLLLTLLIVIYTLF